MPTDVERRAEEEETRVITWVTWVTERPVIAHWIRASKRFTNRMGRQFAAAITYFSVLSMVPILMVAFALVAMTVTVFNPDLIASYKTAITNALPDVDVDLKNQLTQAVDQAFSGWQAVGVVGLGSALWTGSTWVKYVRSSVRAQIRDDFDDRQKPNFLVGLATNIAVLIGLLVLLGLTTALSSVALSVRHQLGEWFPEIAHLVGSWVYTGATLVGTLIGGFLLFCFIFITLPSPPVRGVTLARAASMGALAMAVLQYSAGLLIRVFSNNTAASVFGPVLVLMLFFNLFASLILMLAAWIGTVTVPPPTPVELAEAMPHQPTNYASKLVAARLREDRDPDTVPTRLAVNATRVGVGLGAATTAVLAGIAALISGRRR